MSALMLSACMAQWLAPHRPALYRQPRDPRQHQHISAASRPRRPPATYAALMHTILTAIALTLILAPAANANTWTSPSLWWKDHHEKEIADFTNKITSGKLRPKDLAEAYASRGSSYASLVKHELALADYDQARKLDPNSVGHRSRAESLWALGRKEAALKNLDASMAGKRPWTAMRDTTLKKPGLCQDHPSFSAAARLSAQSEAAFRKRDMRAANRLADAAWRSSSTTIEYLGLARGAGILDDSPGDYEHTVEAFERKGQLEWAAYRKLSNLRETLWFWHGSSCAGPPVPPIKPPPIYRGKGK